MSAETLIIWLIIGGVAGWLAGLIVKGYGFGIIGNIVVGIVGAFIGGWVFGRLGIATGLGILGEIIAATVGAVILLLLIRLVRKAA
jgi:uncharacterized membrane protein YeaQ/YmgE (transglycosylase-associated protein family)